MPVQDVEMGSKQPPIARGGPKKSKGRRGQYRLPVTIAACFAGLFVFFVVLSGASSRSHANKKQKNPRHKAQKAAGVAAAAATGAGGPPKVFTYRVVNEFPHDQAAFTQGLQFDRVCSTEKGGKEQCRDVFWESTGLNGQSTVREVELETGKVLRSKKLPQSDFGEGLTRHGDRLYQVTWMSPRTWSYAAGNFEDARVLETPLRDGWGITSDGSHLIVGDSSDKLYWLDPVTMKAVRQVAVTDNGKPVAWLNELEYIDGVIWANIWQTDCIAQIDPQSGSVLGWVRLTGLRQRTLEAAAADARQRQAANRGGPRPEPEVLNGIAYDAEQRRLFIGGKQWPRVYQIETQEVPAGAAAALQTARQQCIVRGGQVMGL